MLVNRVLAIGPPARTRAWSLILTVLALAAVLPYGDGVFYVQIRPDAWRATGALRRVWPDGASPSASSAMGAGYDVSSFFRGVIFSALCGGLVFLDFLAHIALDAPQIDHERGAHDHLAHTEASAHGELIIGKGPLDGRDGRFDGGPRIAGFGEMIDELPGGDAQVGLETFGVAGTLGFRQHPLHPLRDFDQQLPPAEVAYVTGNLGVVHPQPTALHLEGFHPDRS